MIVKSAHVYQIGSGYVRGVLAGAGSAPPSNHNDGPLTC